MSAEQFDPKSAFVLDITPAAVEFLCKQLERQSDKSGVKIGVKKSGCSGFKYDIDFVVEPNEDDEKIEFNSDLTLFIAADAKAFLRGTQIDFVKEGLNHSIKFNNPNAKDLCGCGESFSV